MWSSCACTKYHQRARRFCSGNLKETQSNQLVSKNYLPDVHSDGIVLMRRNDGDAASQYAKHLSKAFARRRSVMQFS
jgi:hypothetical protein